MMILIPTVAHLMGASPHVADILLYGGAGIGAAAGLGLFVWGRHTRRSLPGNQPPEWQPGQRRPVHRGK